MSDKKETLLVVAPGKTGGDQAYHLLVAETGEVLAQHWCSGPDWAKGDLYENRPERIEEYENRFGDVKVEFLDDTDITEDQLISRNRAWYDSEMAKAEAMSAERNELENSD